MLHKGYDYFTRPVGSDQQLNCRVCGQLLTDRPRCVGPTGFVEAMAGHAHEHDAYACEYSDTAWHERALRLVREIKQTSSPRVAAIMKRDLDEVLAAR